MFRQARHPLLAFLILSLFSPVFSLPEKEHNPAHLEKRDDGHLPRQLFGLPWGLFNRHEPDDDPAARLDATVIQTEVPGTVLPDGIPPEGQLTTHEQSFTPQDPAHISTPVPRESLTDGVHPEELPTEGLPTEGLPTDGFSVTDGGNPPTEQVSALTSLIVGTDTRAPPSTVVIDHTPSLPSDGTQIPPATSLINGDHQGSVSEIIHSATIPSSTVESNIESNLGPHTQTLSTLWPTGSAPASTDTSGSAGPADAGSAGVYQSPSDITDPSLSHAASHSATVDSDPGQQLTATVTPTSHVTSTGPAIPTNPATPASSATSMGDTVGSMTDLTVLQPHTSAANVEEITLWPTAQTQRSAADDSTQTATAGSRQQVESPGQQQSSSQQQTSPQQQTPAPQENPAQQGNPIQEETPPQQETQDATGPPDSATEASEADAENAEATQDRASSIAARSGGLSPAGAGPGPCPACPTPSCPGNPTPTPTPAADPRQGPCPGRGYSCPDCLDGWFCPPEHTPIQRAPCGYGWPCYHCSGGWYCAPAPTQLPCAPNGPATVTATVTAASVPRPGNDDGSCIGASCPPGSAGNGNNNNGGDNCPGGNCPPGTTGNGNNDGGGSCTGANCPPGSTGSGNNDGGDSCAGGNCPGNDGGINGTPDSYGGPEKPDQGNDGLTARAAPEAAGWKYLGCFNDTPGRTIDCDPNDWYAGNMTNAKCVAYCDKKGYKLAGTEYSRECWCGNVFQNAKRLPDIQCHMVCDGNSTDVCGGDWALTVYSRDGTAANTITQEEDDYGNKAGGQQARDNAKAQGYGDGNEAASKPSFTPTTVFLTLSTPAATRPTSFFTAAEPPIDTDTANDGVHILSAIQSMLGAIPSDLGFGDDRVDGPGDEGPGSPTAGQKHDDSRFERRSDSHAKGNGAVQTQSFDTTGRPQRLTKEWRA